MDNKLKIEQLIAQNHLEQAIESLFEMLTLFLKTNKDNDVQESYNNLIILSGQRVTAVQEGNLGRLGKEGVLLEKTRIGFALLDILKQLPEQLFQIEMNVKQAQKPITNTKLTTREIINLTHNKNYEYDIFFRFSSKDIEAARPICDELRGYGFRIFFTGDSATIKAGVSFMNFIDDALEQSKNFLLFCTPNAMKSNHVIEEYSIFYENYFFNDRENRAFIIYEGTNFDLNLLKARYRRLQTAKVVNEVIDALVDKNEQQRFDLEQQQRQQEKETQQQKEDVLKKNVEQKRITQEAEQKQIRLENEKRKTVEAERLAKEKADQERQKKMPPIENTLIGDFILVEGGTFKMGNDYGDEKPIHPVTVSDFYIGKTPVTQKQWRQIMDSDPKELYFKGNDDNPVENVSWNDVQEFLKKLNTQTDKKFRLPTEAEWEYAARGGNKSKGYTYSGSNNIDEVAWYSENSGGQTKPVAQKKSNELGIYDMSGNVWEWCEDWYASDFYEMSKDAINPLNTTESDSRVLRGGGWSDTANFCRAAIRSISAPGIRFNRVGFRLCFVP
jgi:formylglycine-generating enzyme required for sulfatase activity